jgi:excisionase family DNA binding protein
VVRPVPFRFAALGPSASSEYLTPSEVASHFRVHRRTVYNWMRSGELPAIRAGRQWRISYVEIGKKERSG